MNRGISWTPDNRLIYGSNASGGRDIWLLDTAQGTPQKLTANVGQGWYFVPGGNRGGANIGEISFAGGEIKKLLVTPFRLSPILRWTPDGTALAYLDSRGPEGNILALPIDGGAPKQSTDFKSDALFESWS